MSKYTDKVLNPPPTLEWLKPYNVPKTGEKKEKLTRRGQSARKRLKQRVYRRYVDPRCHYCKIELTYGQATVDHKQPVSKGGTDDEENLVLACYKCNHDKGDQTEEDYKNRSSE